MGLWITPRRPDEQFAGFSSNPAYVTALSADVAVISVGKNSFGHPDPTVIARWETLGDVYITQAAVDDAFIDGDITIVTDGIAVLTVTTETSATPIQYPLDQE